MSEVFYESTAELATLTNTFAVAGVPTAPTTISLAVTDPAGTTTTYTFAAAEITNPSPGVYTKDIPCTADGVWMYLWVGTGTASDAQAGTWTVQRADVNRFYCTLEELQSRTGAGSSHDFELLGALGTATKEIDKFCGRTFHRALTATARTFRPTNAVCARVDDFWTTTGLIVKTDNADAGTYPTTLTDYALEPADGIVDGEEGWPYSEIIAINTTFTMGRRRSIQITAKWGWAAVPEPVREACLIVAQEAYKLKDSAFGVGGYGNFGIIRVRDNPMAARKLMPYQRDSMFVA